jgi:hypothetical protein
VTFNEFKASSAARDMFRKMGLQDYLEEATSWRHLRALIVDFNDNSDGKYPFVALARECDGVASSGEQILLHAILYVTDFAWLADELSGTDKRGGLTWRNMDRVSGEHRRCVVACIGAEESP